MESFISERLFHAYLHKHSSMYLEKRILFGIYTFQTKIHMFKNGIPSFVHVRIHIKMSMPRMYIIHLLFIGM